MIFKKLLIVQIIIDKKFNKKLKLFMELKIKVRWYHSSVGHVE